MNRIFFAHVRFTLAFLSCSFHPFLRAHLQMIDAIIEQNLDLCCVLLERAAMDRAIREVDDSLATQVAQRKAYVESGVMDASVTFVPVSPWTRSLPGMLQPRPGGLTQEQLMVYEAFNRLPRSVSPVMTSAAAPTAVPPIGACLQFVRFFVDVIFASC